MKVVYYLINLDDNTDRYSDAAKHLSEQGIEFIRVPAFDGRKLTPSIHPQYSKEKCLSYMGRELVGGEIGCYISHLQCANLFIESDADFAVVLEDDFKPAIALKNKIGKTLEFLNNVSINWDLINIGNQKIKISTKLFEVEIANEIHELHHAHYFPMTTTGLIWSRPGAEDFIRSSTVFFCPVDNYLRYWLTRKNTGLAFKPPLLTSSGVESVIHGTAHKSKYKRHRKLVNLLSMQERLWGEKFIALWHKFKVILGIHH